MRGDHLWDEHWAEAFAIFFLALGVVLAVGLRNPLFSYITIFLSGALAGRIFYQKRCTEPILPFILIIIGFLLGYLLGSFWTSRITSIILFALGLIGSYYLHQKEIFVIFKNRGFVK